jgi:hypothetical protein
VENKRKKKKAIPALNGILNVLTDKDVYTQKKVMIVEK